MTRTSLADVEEQIAIKGYEITGVAGFGAGGTAVAVRGRDGRAGVACIVPRDDRVDRVRELGHLRHPHLPRVRDVVDVAGNRAAVIMDLVVGPSLAALVAARSWLPPAEVVTLWRAIADALAAMHTRGLVHGDVSPANILLGPGGTPVLVDVVGHGGAERGHTGYIPPELDDGPATAASDVWSLARTLAWASGDDERVLRAVGSALADEPARRPAARDFSTWAFLLGPAESVTVPGAAALAGAQLRAAAAPTVLVAPKRSRGWPRIAAVLTLLTVAGMLLAGAAGPAPRAVHGWSAVLDATEAESVARGLMARRDAALEARDRGALQDVYQPGAAAAARDEALITSMEAEGTVFRGYRTEARWLGAVSRTPGAFTVQLEVRQLAHERETGGEAIAVPEQPAHCVAVDLVGEDAGRLDEWRIAAVRPCG